MKRHKRLLPLILVLTMLCSSPAFTAYAADKADAEPAQSETASQDIIVEEQDNSNVLSDDTALPETENEEDSEIIADTEQEDDSSEEASDAGSDVTPDASPDISSEGLTEQAAPEENVEEASEEIIVEEPGEGSDEETGEETDTPESIDDVPFFSNQQSMFEYVRDKAVHREGVVKVCVTSENLPGDDKGFDEILRHTGNPAEGDYLKWSLEYYDIESIKNTEADYYTITYRFGFYETPEEAQAVDAEVSSLVSALGLKDSSKSDYEKTKSIFDYVVTNLNEGNDPYCCSGYTAFIDHSCSPYVFSMMFYRLALEAGLDNRIVHVSYWHNLNIVHIYGSYYIVDPYQAYEWYAEDPGDVIYDCFLRGKKDSDTHSEFNWPADIEESYDIADYDYAEFTTYGNAPDYVLTTIDQKIISSAAKNGRAKAILFIEDESENARKILNELSGKTFPGVDLIVTCHPYFKSLIGEYYPESIPGEYSTCSNVISLYDKVLAITGERSYLSLILINAQNQIVYINHDLNGLYADGFVPSMIERLSDPAAPPYQDDSADYGDYTEIGTCGEHALWFCYSDGTLRIRGTGEINNWSVRPSSSNLNKTVIESGITGIRDSSYSRVWFAGNWVEIPSSVKTLDFGVNSEFFTFCGAYGSAAYKYARAHEITFVDPSRILYYGKTTVDIAKTTDLQAIGLGTLTYTSSNTKICTVSSKGVVKGIGPGTATVKITASGDGERPAVTKNVTITVKKCATPTISKLTWYSKGVKISIKKVAGATKYRVFYKTGSSGWKKVADTTGTTLSFKCTSGKTYTFTVRALNQYGNYVSDNDKTGKKFTYLTKPDVTSISNPKKGSVYLKWKKVSNSDGYQIRYVHDSDYHQVGKIVHFNGKPVVQYHDVYHYKYITVKGVNNLSKTVNNLKKNKVYGFDVRSYKIVSGQKAYSPWGQGRAVKIFK